MKFRKCTIILCSLFSSLFISFSLFFLSLLNDESKTIEVYKYENENNSDVVSLLATTWNEGAEEALSKKFIKLYSIDIHAFSNSSPWMFTNKWVSSTEIHPDSPTEMGYVLKSMNTKKIIWADVGHKGTQLKLTIKLEGGQYAVFKPKWYERDAIIYGQPYDGRDRHNGEIVSFHVNRILGLRRAPFAVGRIVDLQEEIMPVATKRLRQTFFIKNDNICFLGKCLYCRTREDAACGKGKKMEGAVVLWLPKSLTLKQYRHPWSRTYNINLKAKWELSNTSKSYCDTVQEQPMYNSSRSLILDIIDTSIFDFIIGNADRHHFEVFSNSTKPSLLLIDNAKSFGNPVHDERSILAPLLQCKFVRKSTIIRLNELKNGIIMRVLKAVLTFDPIAPLITDLHLEALGRRLNIVIEIMQNGGYTFL